MNGEVIIFEGKFAEAKASSEEILERISSIFWKDQKEYIKISIEIK